MGAGSGFDLEARAFAGALTLATAQGLASGIRQLEHFDLILCGNATVDSGTGQVAVQLAEFLDLPCVTDVEEIAFENEQSLIAKRKWEDIDDVVGCWELMNEPDHFTDADILIPWLDEMGTYVKGIDPGTYVALGAKNDEAIAYELLNHNFVDVDIYTVHPWYVLWALPFAALRRNRAWIMLTGLVLLGYWGLEAFHARGEWPQPLWARLLLWVPVFGLLAFDSLRDRYRSRSAPEIA